MIRNALMFCLLLLTVMVGLQSAAAAERVYIDINSPAFQRFPVAVTNFQKLGGEPLKEDLSVWFSDTLSRYLDMTGYIKLISRKAFLEDQRQFPYVAGRVHFPDWTVIGAEYLVKGAFSLTGRIIVTEFALYDVVKGEKILEKRYSAGLEERRSLVQRIAQEITQTLTGDGSVFDTKIAFVMKQGQSSNIYTINFDGSDLTKITNFKSVALSPRWSPDGQAIVFTAYKDGNPDLYFRRLKDYGTRKISNFRGLNLAGGWSNDGRNLLLTLSKDGNEEIYQMDLSSGQLKRVTREYAIDVSAVWSPDGRRIAFVSNRSGSPQIFIMNDDGTQAKRLTFEGSYNTSPAWSPKGNRIAFEGRKNGRFRIFSTNEDGSNLMQIGPETGDNESPSWSPDGRYLAFSQRGRAAGKIYIMNANGTNIRTLYENPSGCISPSWSPRLK